MNKIIIGIGVAVLVLGGIIWIARPSSQNSATALPEKSGGCWEGEPFIQDKKCECGARCHW